MELEVVESSGLPSSDVVLKDDLGKLWRLRVIRTHSLPTEASVKKGDVTEAAHIVYELSLTSLDSEYNVERNSSGAVRVFGPVALTLMPEAFEKPDFDFNDLVLKQAAKMISRSQIALDNRRRVESWSPRTAFTVGRKLSVDLQPQKGITNGN